MGAFGWVGQFARDLRFGVRGLAQVRGFSAIAIGSLALGIGGSTAMYSVIHAVILDPFPYRDPDRLMAIETRKAQQPEIEPWTSALDFSDFRNQARSFESVSAISPVWNVVLTGRGAAQHPGLRAVETEHGAVGPAASEVGEPLHDEDVLVEQRAPDRGSVGQRATGLVEAVLLPVPHVRRPAVPVEEAQLVPAVGVVPPPLDLALAHLRHRSSVEPETAPAPRFG